MNRQSEKITAIYCRIDSPGSPEHIIRQKERALSCAKDHHLQNPGLFIDDGFTGTSLDRPQVQNMVREIMAGRVQAIVVTDIGRLVRGCSQFLDFVEQVLAPYGVALHSASGGLYTPRKDNYVRLVAALYRTEGGRT